MNFEGINFPVYRKYRNNKSYFKIINPALFEEVQLIGSRKVINRVEAKLFPEKMVIHDLVFNYTEMAEAISEADYEAIRGI